MRMGKGGLAVGSTKTRAFLGKSSKSSVPTPVLPAFLLTRRTTPKDPLPKERPEAEVVNFFRSGCRAHHVHLMFNKNYLCEFPCANDIHSVCKPRESNCSSAQRFALSIAKIATPNTIYDLEVGHSHLHLQVHLFAKASSVCRKTVKEKSSG